MDTKDHVAAGNALIGWFNSQEIPPADAHAIMSKVIAKLIVGRLSSSPHGTTVGARNELDAAVDSHMLRLVHDINDRLFNVR